MEGNNNIDKDLKQLRDRFEVDPPENAWNLLDTDLERKQATMYRQSRNRFKLLSILLALMLISFVTYYWFYTPTTLSGAKNSGYNGSEANANDLVKSTKKASITNNTTLGNASGKNIFVSKMGQEALHDKESINQSSPSLLSNKNQQLKAKDDEVVVGKQSVERNNRQGTLENGSMSINNGSSSRSSQYNQVMGKNEVTAITHHSLSLSNKHNQVSIKNKTLSEKGDKLGLITNKKQNDEKSDRLHDTSNLSASIDNNSKENNIAIVISDSSLRQAASNSKPAETSLVKGDSAKINIKKDSLQAKIKGNKSQWSIAAFYTPNYFTGFHLLKNGSVHSYGYNPNNYSQGQKTNYSYAAGLAVGYDLSSHWGLSLGGTYSTIAYSMALSTIYARYDANWQLQYQYPTVCGNIEIPNTSNTTLHYGDSLKTPTSCTQVVKLISVPLTVRFHIAKNRLKLYADGGVSANFILQEKANMVIGSTQTTIINNIDGLQKMNYSYLVGIGFEYGFYHCINFFIEPSFRGSISSLTQKTAYYCYPYTFNLNTGLSFHF